MSDLGEEASRMLALALEQMDDIIAAYLHSGSNFSDSPTSPNGSVDSCSSPLVSGNNKLPHSQHDIPDLISELKLSLEQTRDGKQLLKRVPKENMVFLKNWFANVAETSSLPQQTNGLPGSPIEDNLDAKLSRLEADRESLSLQVSVLTDQVEAQGEKIAELESQLASKQDKLSAAEHRLQQELLNKSSLETHKLDMMAEISSLKLRLATAERDRRDMMERYNHAQSQINELKTRLNDRDMEIVELKSKLSRNGTLSDPYIADVEVEKLKKAVETLMIANDEKERKIDELMKMMLQYRQREEMILQGQGRKLGVESAQLDEDNRSDSSSAPSLPEPVRLPEATPAKEPQRAHMELFIHEHPTATKTTQKVNGMPYPTATSTPVHYGSNGTNGHSPAPSTINISPTPKKPVVKSTSCEDIAPTAPKTPPAINKEAFGGSLPRDHINRVNSKKSRGSSFGKGFFKLKHASKWSSSAPNLGWQSEDEAQTECATTDDEDPNSVHPKVKPEKKKSKGIKRFFGSSKNDAPRMRRSSSQDLETEEDKPAPFKRGGVRATAGARLGWSSEVRVNDLLNVPFARWDTERISMWLHEIGLSMYVGDCKRWVKNGAHLLNAGQHEYEKELGIKNVLHRKKLQLALSEVMSDAHEPHSLLSHEWVTRWLDDIGLPQYKDVFSEARVDGRMLNHLTVDDLLCLKITSALHHASIKCGIQVLRQNSFSPSCLQRRAAPGESTPPTSSEVLLWTNHRVMEWLRTIDLSEYAPNLRGSGIHGAFMILEDRFSVENLAAILSIPANKTLLRRHLSTHFVELVSNEVMCRKREVEPLQISAKVKRRGIFNKRGRSSTEPDDFLCPPVIESNGNTKTNGDGYRREIRGMDTALGKNKEPLKQYSALSKEVNTLTDMLEEENLYDNVYESVGPTSTV